MTSRSLSLFAVLLLLPFCAVASAQQPVASYLVGPQDVLAVTVFDQPSLSGKFAVEADGTFTLPLIGRVTAGGLSLREVEAAIRQRLKQGYLKDPQVIVAVDEYRSQRVFVVGEVRSPGAYFLTGQMTLIEALARAGSTTEHAGREAIIVHGGGDAPGAPSLPTGTETAGADVVRVELADLQAGAALQSILLHDGDTIFVRRAGTVYVSGQVRNPGAYPIQADTTVRQALSLAGGVTDRGAANRTRVVRVSDGKKLELKVNEDDPVTEGDTIIVPGRFF